MPITLIRHGKTFGNTLKRYIGRTDEDLCQEGIQELETLKMQYPFQPDYLFVSPLKRCRQTAQILFPDCDQIIIDDLRECDFGDFENKNYKELSGNPDYQAWIDSNGTLPFPNGESMELFQSRCVDAFRRIIQQYQTEPGEKHLVFVVHGGTIMSIMDAINQDPDKSYFDFQVKNGESVKIEHMIAF